MKKKIKFCIVIISILFLVGMQMATYAFTPGDITGDSNIDITEAQDLGNFVIGVIQTVGNIIAVIVLLILGVKFAMGGVEEKANYKKTLLPYFIGAVILFSASNLTGIVYNIIDNSLNTSVETTSEMKERVRQDVKNMSSSKRNKIKSL